MEVEKHHRMREAAALLGVCRDTVLRWINSGELGPVIAVSMRDFRIPASVLQRFIEHREIVRRESTRKG